jgi:hypothetical protein
MTVVFLTLHGRTRGHGLSQPRPPGKSQSGSQRPLQIIVFYNGRVFGVDCTPGLRHRNLERLRLLLFRPLAFGA